MLIVRQSHPASWDISSWVAPVPRAFLAGAFLGACVGLWIGNGHTTHDAVQHISDQYGQAKKQLGAVQKALPGLTAAEACEHNRAQITAELALQTMQVSPDQIPPDCPHPAIPKVGTK